MFIKSILQIPAINDHIIQCQIAIVLDKHCHIAFAVFGNIDRAGEAAAVFERQVQRRDRVDEDVAVQGLTIGGEIDLRAVAAGCAPAM